MSHAKPARNREIFEARERGELWKVIAATHGISIRRAEEIWLLERDRRGLPRAEDQRRRRRAQGQSEGLRSSTTVTRSDQ